MKKIINLLLILISLAVVGRAQVPPTGEEILKRVDANIGSDNKIATAEMMLASTAAGAAGPSSPNRGYTVRKNLTQNTWPQPGKQAPKC